MGVLSVSLVSGADAEEATLKTKTVFMNHQTFKLEPLSDQELISIEGGAIPSWLKNFGWSGLFYDAIKNWDEIKREFRRGWHFADNK
jgi:hypothetical protein